MAAVKIMFYISLFGGVGYGFLKLVEGQFTILIIF